VRVTDQATFNTHASNLGTYHHYAKNGAWNSDGTLIKCAGWPSAILDGETFEFIKTVWPPGGHHTWSHTQPNIIYGTNHPNYDGNCIAQLDVTTNTTTLVSCFNEYSFVSHGEGEGNMSNDDRYMALQCRRPSGEMAIACYDFVNDEIVSTMNAPVWPNNVTMTQSGNYVIVQWNVAGTNQHQGTWAYNRSDMSPVRNLSHLGGSHFDYGYDTQGNEVIVGPSGVDRGIIMKRIDNGQITNLLGDNQMSWYIHVSCRNIDRPGWAYLTEFANENTQTFKPNYQKIFAVQLDPNATNNALTETFAHVHHSPHVNYNRSPFGTSNRDGSKVIFRSDWMGNSSSEINSYVAFMPPPPTVTVTCNLKVLLEGALDQTPSTMYNRLQQYEVLPSGHPYNVAPWNYQGTEGAGWQAADYPANTVDWVLLSFRESASSNSEVAKVATVLLTDGSIAPVQIPLSSAINSLYVVVEHRNHLPAMSPMPVNIVNNTLIYDFTSENSYPSTSLGQKLINNYWCLFAGNGDQTSGPGYDINGADKIPFLEENGDFGDYFRADYNLDADVTGADKAVWFNNNGAFSLVPQ